MVETTGTATAKSVEADERARNGVNVAQAADQSIHRMRDSITQSVETINALSDRTREVAEVLDVINDIAEQTNLLALNANIEAARAASEESAEDAIKGLAVSERLEAVVRQLELQVKQFQIDRGKPG